MHKIISLPLLFTMALTGCDESIKTKEQLSKLTSEEFAVQVCSALKAKSLEQLELMIGEDYDLLQQFEKQINHDEFDDFIEPVNCSNSNVDSKEKKGKVYWIANFKDESRLRFGFTKENGIFRLLK